MLRSLALTEPASAVRLVRRAPRATARQLQSLPAVYDGVPVGICVIDRDLCVVSINRRMVEMTGRPAESGIGRRLAEIIPGIATQFEPHLQRALCGEPVADFELRDAQADPVCAGRIFLVSLQPLRDAAGEIEGVLCSAQDITNCKQAEQALWEHRERLSTLIEQAAVGICQADTEGHILLVNDRYCELVGRPREALLTSSVQDLTHPDDLPLTQALLGRLAATGEAFALEKRYVLPDGGFVWVSNYVSAAHDVAGRVQYIIGVSQDITERKQAEAALQESERRLRLATEGAGVGTWEVDRAAGIGHWSPEAMALLGVTRARFSLADWTQPIHPEDRSAVIEAWHRAVAENASFEMEFRATVPAPDGGERWLLSRGGVDRNATARLGRAAGVLLDVTARRRAKADLRASEERLARAIAAGRISTWEWHLASDALHVSSGFDALFGQPPGTARTMQSLLSLVHPEDRACLAEEIKRALADAEERDRETEFRVVTADGAVRWLRMRGRVERGADGKPERLTGVTGDVTDRRQAEQQLAWLAYHDPLTGLPNRLLFHRDLEQACTARQPNLVALHLLDLDHFKGVNDTLGHLVGDALLQQAAERLRDCLQAGETVARLGGDEFAVIQTDLHGPDDAARLARTMIAALGRDYDIKGQRVAAGASIGIALAPDRRITPDELVKDADIALYEAKSAGRGTFCCFEPGMAEAVRRREAVRAGLRLALEHQLLELHFQPLIGTEPGQVTCMEALLRWRQRDGSLIAPTDWISIAEDSGLIVAIGAWALRSACREAVRWPEPIRVAVNLSPIQFRGGDLPQTVAAALAESGLPAHRLELEITESLLLPDNPANLAVLHQLRDMGTRIVLDDFGVGFSSLGYLLRFPFDKIKIDRAFVAGLPHRPECRAIVRAIIGLGRSLGIGVTAEGVETEAQWDSLRREACVEAQGYLFSDPIPAAEVIELLHRLRQPATLHA